VPVPGNVVSVPEACFSQFNQGGKKEVRVTEVHEVCAGKKQKSRLKTPVHSGNP
jgi:hypothetical protein